MTALPRLAAPGGSVYVESSMGIALSSPWVLHRSAKAGHVTFQLFHHADQ
jgi:hypothetical protein